MDEDEARSRFATGMVARLATVRPDGSPHVVPVVFALDGDTVVSAVDDKPKRTKELRRVANIRADPRVSLLVDHYEEEWPNLWWVRARPSTGQWPCWRRSTRSTRPAHPPVRPS